MYPLFWLVLIVLVIAWYFYRASRSRTVPQFSPAEVSEKLSTSRSTLLLDVRTDAERSESHIKGSIHIPLQLLRSRAGELARYKGNEIICYCRSGNRSISAALILRGLGFNAASMRGGLVEWNFSQRL